MVPEASPLSIDLLSPNFSMTYALLNSHYCAHWSLIRENNRPVVTEGKNMSRPVTVWAQTHDFSSLSPLVDLYAHAGRVKPGVRILNSTRTVCRWIRKLDLARYEPPPSSKNKEGRSFAIKLSLWYVSSSDDSQFLPAPSPAPLLTSCYLFLSIICFSALLDKE